MKQEFNTKTKIQQLTEGNIEQRPPIQHRRKNKKTKNENNTKTSVSKTTKQKSLLDYQKDKQRTLFNYA